MSRELTQPERREFRFGGVPSFGGGSLFSDYLIYVTDNHAVAGVWLMFAAACSFVATLLAFRMSSAASAATVASSIQPAR